MTTDLRLDPAVQEGAILFGRYAFPPNRLGYCGPDESGTILGYVAEQRSDRGLLALERRFEGAYPYLRLIAMASGVADPFDRRVVEAYWIGNELLGRVTARPFYDSLVERFRPRMSPGAFRWLAGKLEHGARPHHNFHVFDVYLRAGLMRNERATVSVEHMDRCRISWGRVVSVEGPSLRVERRPLELREGRLLLGEPAVVTVARQIDGRGFVTDPRPGDIVSIHWDWACEVLTPRSLRWLRAETRRALNNANLTL
ncbi:MAG: DUF6390 family protein [Bacillota bacterium]|nr:DUF6390 family protein [Bacillota bacterium]